MKIKLFNEEVFYTDEEITKVNTEDIAWLKSKALANKRQRVRLCSHSSVHDTLHEMLIIHVKNAYVRPHKHPEKSESFHMIEGQLNVIIFSEEGAIREIIEMGEYSSGRRFYYRLVKGAYHTVVPISEVVVFHEVTNGPFNRGDTIFAEWSPKEDDTAHQILFLNELKQKAGKV